MMEATEDIINNTLLHKLRDIHLPDPVSFYPLPSTWWISLVSAVLLIVGLWFFVQYKLKAAQRKALKKLDKLELELKNNSNHSIIFMELSYLLKHYVKEQYPNTFASSLVGEAWLDFLDLTSNSKAFSQGTGKALRTLPYKNNSEESELEIFTLVRLWIKQHPYKTKKNIMP